MLFFRAKSTPDP